MVNQKPDTAENKTTALWESTHFLAMLGIAVITFVAFFPTLSSDFVMWDDDISIYRNELITQLNWDHLKKMFQNNPILLKYAPLYWLSLAFTHLFFGLNPFGYHLTNLLLHVASSIVLYHVLFRIFSVRFQISKQQIVLAAFFGSLFWSIHPLRVNTVCLAANRTYCQSTFFILISLLLYLKAMDWRDNRESLFRYWTYWFSVVFFASSLLSFPIGLCFMVVYVCFDLYRLEHWAVTVKTLLLEKMPFLVVTIGLLFVNLGVRAMPQGIRVYHQYSQLDLHQTLKAFYMWAFYLWKPWAPFNLSPVNPILIQSHPSDLSLIASTAAIISISLLLIFLRKRYTGLFLVFAVHLVILVPVLGITEKIHYPAERYAYLQGMVWSVVIGGGLCLWYQHSSNGLAVKRSLFVTIPCVLLLTSFTFPHTMIWKNSLSLFHRILYILDENPYRTDIFWRLSRVYFEHGDVAKAFYYSNRVLEVDPDHPRALVYRGASQVIAGKYEMAVEDLMKAIAFSPNDPYVHFWLAEALFSTQRPCEAEIHFKKAHHLGDRNTMVLDRIRDAAAGCSNQ